MDRLRSDSIRWYIGEKDRIVADEACHIQIVNFEPLYEGRLAKIHDMMAPN